MSIPEPLQVLGTLRDFVRWGSSEFLRNELSFGHGFASALDEARYLVLHALSLPWDWPDEYLDAVVAVDERERVIEVLQARVKTRQPAAYLTRESWFCGLKFYVDERVLVPRSPMAELVSAYFEPWIDSSRVRSILDLCTGSGCLAIAAQYRFPEARVCASDISRDALDVAAINLELHELDEHVQLYESDLFDAIPPQAYDVIVSNPPYVDAGDMAALSAEFKQEPELGLAAGNDGLALAVRILARAGDFLGDEGVLFLEVGNSRAALERTCDYLPLTWIELEYGGGVCCIQARDLQQHEAALAALAERYRADDS